MHCLRPFGLVLVITALSAVNSMPSETTSRSIQSQEEKKSVQENNNVMELNPLSDLVLDTRTPPRIKIHPKKKDKIEIPVIENSHAGVAIPIDEDSIKLEETTKKLSFHKIERPTTNSGLSTWILLSGQTASTTPKKPIVKTNIEENKNITIIDTDSPNKIIKPIFKKRVTTTRKPTTISKISTSSQSTKITSSTKIRSTSTLGTTTKSPQETTKFTKIKASVLTNAVNKKVHPSTTPAIIKKVSPSSTSLKTTTMHSKSTTMKNKLQVNQNSTIENALDSNMLPLEAKDGELDLSTNSTENSNKKSKKPVTKRKKNKNRRRRPTTEKLDSSNSTKIDKVKRKDKPITTQFYNYLSREVMPTVGVGLVGLMVTAGLASYFLYPFGVARRSYEVDRRDKEGTYYYSDAYSGGISEEEAIGKVIAGMPSNSLYTNTYKSPSSRNVPNTRYRRIETRQQPHLQQNYRAPQSTVSVTEAKPTEESSKDDSYRPNYQTETYQPISYNKNVIEQNKDMTYTMGEQKFVVGNVPKQIIEEITPAAVPEHGPRSLKIRRKRNSELNYKENEVDHYNEISPDFENKETTTDEILITDPTIKDFETTTENLLNINFRDNTTLDNSTTTEKTTVTTSQPDKFVSFVHLLKDILHMKINIGLQLIQNASIAVSRYASRVQSRINEHYRNYTLHHNH